MGATAFSTMPFVPDGRGGFCKLKNKNYEGAYVTLLKAAPYGAASGLGHQLSEEDLAHVGLRALVLSEGATTFHNNNTRKLAKVRLQDNGEEVEWPFNWWQDPTDDEDPPAGFAAPARPAAPTKPEPEPEVEEEATPEPEVEEEAMEEEAMEAALDED